MGDSYVGDSNNSGDLLSALSYLSKLFGASHQAPAKPADNASWPAESTPEQYDKDSAQGEQK